MKNLIKKLLRRFFLWLFQEEILGTAKIISEQDAKISKIRQDMAFFQQVLGKMEVSADVDPFRGHSWALITIRGQKHDYIRFVDLSDRDLENVAAFLRQFDQRYVNVDLPRGMNKKTFFRL